MILRFRLIVPLPNTVTQSPAVRVAMVPRGAATRIGQLFSLLHRDAACVVAGDSRVVDLRPRREHREARHLDVRPIRRSAGPESGTGSRSPTPARGSRTRDTDTAVRRASRGCRRAGRCSETRGSRWSSVRPFQPPLACRRCSIPRDLRSRRFGFRLTDAEELPRRELRRSRSPVSRCRPGRRPAPCEGGPARTA